MEHGDIARGVAAEFAHEVGVPLREETDRALDNYPDRTERLKRGSVGEILSQAGNIAQIAAFIVQIIPIIIASLESKKNESDLSDTAVKEATEHFGIEEGLARRIVSAILRRITRRK
ncbi:hypothetical protein [uncultured Bradyrhizobium sp.]|uniref:hypothetical protein n=1 Tax=uncultured Bradyrhizobium sp. TaxID=199684 RepID=UPI0035CAD249